MFQSWQNRTRRLWEKNWCNSALPYSPAIGCLFALTKQCHYVVLFHRKNCASPSSAGQLILPECMKLLPLYTNCLMKSDALSGGRFVLDQSLKWLFFLFFFLSWHLYLSVTSAVTTARSTCQQSQAWTWPAALSTSIPGRSQILWTFTSIFLSQAYSPPHSKSRRNWYPWADQVISRGCYCIYMITILQMHHGESQRRGRLPARKWDPCAPFCRACCWPPVDSGTTTVLFDSNLWPTNVFFWLAKLKHYLIC